MSNSNKNQPSSQVKGKTKKHEHYLKHHHKIDNVNEFNDVVNMKLVPKFKVYETRNDRKILSPAFVESFMNPALDNMLPKSTASLSDRFEMVKTKEQIDTLNRGKSMLFSLMSFKKDSNGYWMTEPMWFCSDVSWFNNNSTGVTYLHQEYALNTNAICATSIANLAKLFAEYQYIQGTVHVSGQCNSNKPIATNGINQPLYAGIDPSDSVALTFNEQGLQLAEGKAFYIQEDGEPTHHVWHAKAVGYPDQNWTPLSSSAVLAYWKMVSTIPNILSVPSFSSGRALYSIYCWLELRFRGQVIYS